MLGGRSTGRTLNNGFFIMEKFKTPFEVLSKVNPVVVGIGLDKLQQEKIEMLEAFACQFMPGYLSPNYIIPGTDLHYTTYTDWCLLSLDGKVIMYKVADTGVILVRNPDLLILNLTKIFELIIENKLTLKP